MTKTCEICAAEYDASRVNQRFCKECGKNSNLARRRYIAAEIRNKENAGDRYKPREYTCKVCGKKTISTYNRTFCSSACLQLHIVNTAKCPVCGVLLTSKGRMTGKGCCSEECRDIQRLQIAKANGRYRACEQCGKKFIASDSNARFCCMSCYRKWQAEQAKPEPKPITYALYKTCAHCGKEFEVTKAQRGMKFCSIDCRQANRDKELQRARELAQRREKKKDAKPVHICLDCRTSQKDCERFTSKFVYIPVGAVQKEVNGKAIILECPKYRR